MKKRHVTIGAVIMGVLAVLGVGAQTVYAAAYTSTQVSQHSTASDCWEIIDGKVYNLTAFIAAHPGGQAAITAQCGKDASAAFHNGPHGASAINAIAQYQVGTVQTATPPPTPTTTTTPTPSTPAATTNTTPAPTNTTVTTTAAASVSSSHDEDEDEDDSDESRDSDDEDGYRHRESLSHELEVEFEVEHGSIELRHSDRVSRSRGHGEDD
jgi:hypothetical protein